MKYRRQTIVRKWKVKKTSAIFWGKVMKKNLRNNFIGRFCQWPGTLHKIFFKITLLELISSISIFKQKFPTTSELIRLTNVLKLLKHFTSLCSLNKTLLLKPQTWLWSLQLYFPPFWIMCIYIWHTPTNFRWKFDKIARVSWKIMHGPVSSWKVRSSMNNGKSYMIIHGPRKPYHEHGMNLGMARHEPWMYSEQSLRVQSLRINHNRAFTITGLLKKLVVYTTAYFHCIRYLFVKIKSIH